MLKTLLSGIFGTRHERERKRGALKALKDMA